MGIKEGASLEACCAEGQPRSTANVNRTIAVLKRMFNLAVREDLLAKNPCWKVKILPENNIRDRVLSGEELEHLLSHLPRHAALIVHFAYLTGMRAGEIFNLTWDRISQKEKVIRLRAEDTKTYEPRLIILDGKLLDIVFEAYKVRALEHNQVFTYKGRTVKSIRKAFLNACKREGITNLRFHDLRHTFDTSMRKAGVPQAVIMKMTGPKTAAMFHRYYTVDLDDGREAYRKLEEHLRQERAPVNPGKTITGTN
jgi:integrase